MLHPVIHLVGTLVMVVCAGGIALSQGAENRVLLDCYYNNEWRRGSDGSTTRYHYTWDDTTNSGFSQLASIIDRAGGKTDILTGPPSSSALRGSAIYIIVDPDTPRETDTLHVLDREGAEEIVEWVRDGGILLLLGNDSANADLRHFNILAERFGIRFNEDCRNRVSGGHYETGTFANLPDHPVFSGVRRIFLKEVSTLSLSPPATAILADGSDVIMATSTLGRGAVVAVGDPWFYNEYMDTRRLPEGFDNAAAAATLFTWLLHHGSRGQE